MLLKSLSFGSVAGGEAHDFLASDPGKRCGRYTGSARSVSDSGSFQTERRLSRSN